jgi:hypothetical protein
MIDWRNHPDKRSIFVDGNRLHQLAKGNLNAEKKAELENLLAGLATRQCAYMKLDESYVDKIVSHCMKILPDFNPHRGQAFCYFTTVIINEIRVLLGQQAKYSNFDRRTDSMHW